MDILIQMSGKLLGLRLLFGSCLMGKTISTSGSYYQYDGEKLLVQGFRQSANFDAAASCSARGAGNSSDGQLLNKPSYRHYDGL